MAYDIGPKIGIEGEKEFRKALGEINTSLKTLGTEMKAVTSAYDKNDKSASALTSRNKVLNKQIDEQNNKLKQLKQGLQASKDKYGENDQVTQKWQQSVNQATADLNNMERELRDNGVALKNVERGFDDAGNKLDEFGNVVGETEKKSSRLSDIFKGAFFANLASRAISAVTSKIREFASSAIEAGDRIGTMSEVIGLSTDRLQELEYAGIRLDVSLGTITGSLTKLVRNMNSARAGSKLQAEAFAKLGIEITNADGSLRDANTVFGEAVDALGKVGNETERDAISMQLFGKSAQELNPLIKAGSDELERLAEEAHKAGAVMSEEAISALDNFGETVERAKLSARAFIGEALAGIIGDGKTAAQAMDGLQDSLSNTSNTQNLIDKYRRLSAELRDSSLSSVQLADKTAELEKVKQDLIAVSNGVVTAFDIENGTFEQQIGVLKDATQAERDYIKSKLTTQVLENSGEAGLRKLTAATKSYNMWQDQANIAQEKLNKLKEDAAKGDNVTKAALDTASESLAYFQGKASDASAAVTEAKESAFEAEGGLRALADNGLMTAEEACITFGLSAEELNAILMGTGDAAENTIPAVEAFGDSLDAIRADYDAAYESALTSLQGQYDLWSQAPEVVATSVAEMQAAADSNTEYFTNYANNLETAMTLDIPGLDMQPLLDSIARGTPEAYAQAQALADAIASGDTDAIASLALKAEAAEASQKRLAEQLGLIQADVENRTEEAVKNVGESIKELDNSSEAAEAAKNTLLGFTRQLAKDAPALVTRMENLGSDLVSALNRGAGNRSPSKKTKESAKNVIEGAVIGLDENKARLFSTSENVGLGVVEGLAIGMKNGSDKVMETSDDIAKELASRVGNISSAYATSSDIAELQYKLWEVANGMTATPGETQARKSEMLTQKIGAQQKSVEAISAAYAKMAELTGGNSEESLKLQKNLLQEQIELQKLQTEYANLQKVKEYTYDIDKLSKMAEDEFKLWSLQNPAATDAEKLAKQTELLALKYEMQGVAVGDTEDALADMVDQYGKNSEESVKIREQLLKEKIAYYELEEQIRSVNRARGYVGDFKGQPTNFMTASEIWAGMQIQKPDVGGMIAGAVNALATTSSAPRGDLVIEVPINGQSFYRATLHDFRTVEASSPQVRSDRL